MADWQDILIPLAVALTNRNQKGAAFLQGYQQSSRLQTDRQRQQERDAQQAEIQQAQLRNLDADNARADQQFQMQQTSQEQAAIERLLNYTTGRADQIAEVTTDPLAAQNQLAGEAFTRANLLKLPPTAAAGTLPNMGGLISGRMKKQAVTLVADYDKKYGPQAAEAQGTLRLTSGPFAGKTMAEVRVIAEALPPPPPVKKAPTPGSFEEYVNAPPDRQAVIESARKRYQQADDRPAQGQRDDRIVQIEGPDGTAVWVRESDAVGKRAAQAARAITGQERQTLAFYNRAKEADDLAIQVEEVVAGAGLASQFQQQYAPNIAQTKDQQRYRQAQRAFTEARLRKESGAAIPTAEYENDARTYFAQPGDSPEVRAQKRTARQTVLDGLKFSSGRAYDEFYGEAPTRRAPSGSGRFEILSVK
jgi:hypothetical protein